MRLASAPGTPDAPDSLARSRATVYVGSGEDWIRHTAKLGDRG